MERRDFLMASSLLGGLALGGSMGGAMAPAAMAQRAQRALGDPASLKGALLDLTTPAGNREAWARLLGNTDMRSTKYGWAQGIVHGVRPGEAVRDLCGFTMLSTARLLPNDGPDGGYRKVLREIGYYTDLASGEIITEWRNPYLNETVPVVPIRNDPFNHKITDFFPDPPNYGGLNAQRPPRRPFQLHWTKRGDLLGLESHINLFYPSALQPAKWPRESGSAFTQVTEMFNYVIPWRDMQDAARTSVEYQGSWHRVTPWLPWMLMGPTPGHILYNTVMGAFDDIERIDRRTLDHVRKNDPLYLAAPDRWTEPSLSSLEWYARQQRPAPVPAGGAPRAPEPQPPAWFRPGAAGATPKT